MVECRRGPAYRRMACGAVRRGKCGSGSGVHRIVRLLPRSQMTLRISAIGRRNRQCVIVVDMAGGAGHVRMAVGQREAGGAMVKRRRGPAHRRVACSAIRSGKRRSRRGMHRIGGLLPGRQMAL